MKSAIRKVSSAGVVTTLAGAALELGDTDGTNSTARFYYPSSVTVDSVGNVFVADSYNSTIRKVTSGGVVTTLAGSAGQFGSANGTNGTARFNYPSGITLDSTTSNLYVADTDNSTLRKVTSTGVVTTLAGLLEQSGSSDADGGEAGFNSPYGVAVDKSGNVHVADTFNNTIRKVTTTGLVGTVAGSPGQPGSADGTNRLARFDGPYAITADDAGNLYVADTLNKTIRKVSSDGVVTTLAGAAGQSGSDDGTNSGARFNGPYGVAADKAGNVYVTESRNHTIRKISSDGMVTTLAGSAGQSGSADGTNSAARFFAPAGIAVDDAGNLYTADIGNSTIRKVTSGGVVTTLAGSAGQVGSADGTGSTARFLAPTGITVDSFGNLFVADSGNSTIRKVTSSGTVTTLAGRAGQAGSADVVPDQARFFGPYGVAVDDAGNVFVADTYNSSIRKVRGDGAVTTLAGLSKHPGSANGTADTARFSYPFGLATDNAGNVFVADSYNNTIRKVTSAGEVTTLAGSAGQPGSADGPGSAARFSYPSGMAVDSAGNIFVTDFDNSTLRKVTSAGVVTTLAGSAGQTGSTDGIGNAARFEHPNGVAEDNAGNLYVADSGNATLRKVTSGGVVTTLAGSTGQRGGIDGTGNAARFDYPFGVAVDRAGNIYLADAGNSTIRKVTSDGMVTTIGGYPGVMGGENGIGRSATFAGPGGIAVDSSGRLYVADAGNNRISRGNRLPLLSIVSSGANVVVSWPSPSSGFALQQSPSPNVINSNSWSTSTYPMNDDGTNKSVIISPPMGNQFFRLIPND